MDAKCGSRVPAGWGGGCAAITDVAHAKTARTAGRFMGGFNIYWPDEVLSMRFRCYLSRACLAAAIVALASHDAAAQTGRVGGVVKNESGQGIKGATVRVENAAASPSTFTASTDDKGRFAILGMARGDWRIVAEAPGFDPMAGTVGVRLQGPGAMLTFTLKKSVANV